MRKSLQWILFLRALATGVLAPVLTLSLLAHGATLQTVSLLIGVYSLTVVAAEFPSGVFADLYGRKTAFLISCAAHLSAFALLLVSAHAATLLAAMALSGLARAFSSGSIDALAIDGAPDGAALVKVTARLSVLESAGLAVGALAGGPLAALGRGYAGNLGANLALYAVLLTLTVFAVHERPRRPVAARRRGGARPAAETAPPWGDPGGIPDACATRTTSGEEPLRGPVPALVARRVPAPQPSPASMPGDPFGAALPLADEPRLSPAALVRECLTFLRRPGSPRVLALLTLLTGFCLLTVETYWQPALSDFSTPSWALGAVSFAGFFSVLLGSKAAERWMLRSPGAATRLLFAQKALLGGCLALLALARGTFVFAGVYAAAYLFIGGGDVAGSALLNRMTPARRRASVLSLFSFLLQIGGLAAALAGYAVSAAGRYRALWLIAGALMVGAAFGLALYRRHRRRWRKEGARAPAAGAGPAEYDFKG
ncbi:MAG: MFS transporter [Clostridiales bacterium]|nr:MFS transporter [Clostridiales bacterium]